MLPAPSGRGRKEALSQYSSIATHRPLCSHTNQKQEFIMATNNDSYHKFCCWLILIYIHTSCFTEKNLSHQQILQVSTGFTTEKSSFSQKLPFSFENLDSHCTFCFTVVSSGKTGFTAIHDVSEWLNKILTLLNKYHAKHGTKVKVIWL